MLNRLLIADDHALMLDALVSILCDEFEIAGTARNGRELLSETERLKPDAVVVDVGMPELNGIEAARAISRQWPWIRLIFVTQRLEEGYVHAAFCAGAKAYVAKQSAATELVSAIHTALNGGYYVTPLAGQQSAESMNVNPSRSLAGNFGAALTPRQREVLQLVAEGKSSKQISAILNISSKTVEFHRQKLVEELGVRTVAGLTRYALSSGIIH